MKFLKERFKYNPATGLCHYIVSVTHKNIGELAGFIGADGYIFLPYRDKQYRVHQFAFYYMTGIIPKLIDHINQNKQDNRWSNLRVADKSINAFNSKLRIDNTSRFRGISFDRFRNKWRAYITVNGKRNDIGRFNTKSEAIVARRRTENENDNHSLNKTLQSPNM